MTPEGKIVREVKKTCKDLGLRFIRNHRGPGAEVGWPDIIVMCPVGCGGEIMWVETKSPGEPLRPIQVHRMNEIVGRGGHYAKPDTEDAARDIVRGFYDYVGSVNKDV